MVCILSLNRRSERATNAPRFESDRSPVGTDRSASLATEKS
jgi:hypothetical protein